MFSSTGENGKQPRKAVLVNKSISLKFIRCQNSALQLIIVRQDITTLGSYHSYNDFIFCHDDCEVKSRNTGFMLQSNLPGMCAFMYFNGQCRALPDDTALPCGKS